MRDLIRHASNFSALLPMYGVKYNDGGYGCGDESMTFV